MMMYMNGLKILHGIKTLVDMQRIFRQKTKYMEAKYICNSIE